MKLVLGLGNPGARYRATCHNLGFRVVDRLARNRGVSFRSPLTLLGRARVAACSAPYVLLAKPRTYMNRSGLAGAALCRRYGIVPREMLVVYDDADLELGRIRLRRLGGAGGHNGVRSLIDALGTGEFARVRLGVRGAERASAELAEYVLGEFEPEEMPVAGMLVELGAEAVDSALRDGMETAMNRYNGRMAAIADGTIRKEDC